LTSQLMLGAGRALSGGRRHKKNPCSPKNIRKRPGPFSLIRGTEYSPGY
jgi:hypothetical protein